MIGTMGRLGLTLALVLSVVLVAVGDPRAASGTASTRVFLPLLPKGGSGPTPTPTHVLPTPTPGTQPTPLPTVVGGPNYSFLNPPNPVNLSSVTADPSRAVSLSLPASGGSLTATAADGTTFNLTIPANALVQPTTITMTPILSVGGLPGTLRLVDGVQLAPDGLRLSQLATLTIELVTERAPDPQIIVRRSRERAHVPAPASGHGRASVRSAARSTFA